MCHKSCFRHYYIAVGGSSERKHHSSGSSDRKSSVNRTSSRFRREAYTLRNLTLVAYIGDEREALASVTPSASVPGSN